MKSSRKVPEYQCDCLNGHKTFGWQRSGFLVFILGGLMCGAILLPYITVVAQNKLPAFIPFISQAGGAPPRTGMMSVCLIVLGFSGIFAFPPFFESINHRNRLNSKWIRNVNLITILVTVLICLGCVVTASFPVDFTELPNQFEWVVTVLLEHGFGASLVLVGIVIYQFLLTWIWWLLPDVTRTTRFIKVAICVVYVIFFFVVVKPVTTFLYEEVGPDVFDIVKLKNVTSYQLPAVFSTSYQICAFFEWAVCFVSLLYIALLYKDFQRISVHVTLRHKTCLMEIPEPAPVMPLKLMS